MLTYGACATTPAGKLDPKVTNALGYLGASYLRSLEVADIEKAGWMPWRRLSAARRASFCGRANPTADEAGADGKEIINPRVSGLFGEGASISNLGLIAPLLRQPHGR